MSLPTKSKSKRTLNLVHEFLITMIVCRYVLQKINGWKIYHLAAGMEDIVDMESELSKRLQEVRMMHKRMKTLIEKDEEEDEDEEDGCIVDEDASSQMLNFGIKDVDNVFSSDRAKA